MDSTPIVANIRYLSRLESVAETLRATLNEIAKTDSTQKFIAGCYNTTEANLHNWLKKNSLKRQVVKIL